MKAAEFILPGKLSSDTPAGDGGAETPVDLSVELFQKWGTAAGQVWILGQHHLAIGDAEVIYRPRSGILAMHTRQEMRKKKKGVFKPITEEFQDNTVNASLPKTYQLKLSACSSLDPGGRRSRARHAAPPGHGVGHT